MQDLYVKMAECRCIFNVTDRIEVLSSHTIREKNNPSDSRCITTLMQV